MSEEEKDEKTKSMFVKVVNSLSFIFGQNPKSMYKVLHEVGSFDQLLILALAAGDMDLDIYDAHLMCKEGEELEAKLLKEKEELKKKMGKVIYLWKKESGSSAQTANSTRGRKI